MLSELEDFIKNLQDTYNVHWDLFDGKTVFRVTISIRLKINTVKNYTHKTYYNINDRIFRNAYNQFENIQDEIRDMTRILYRKVELRTRSKRRRDAAISSLMEEIRQAIKSFDASLVESEISRLQDIQIFLKKIMHDKLSEEYRLRREQKRMERKMLINGEFEQVRDEIIKKFFKFNNVTVLDKSNKYRAVLLAEVHREEVQPYAWEWRITSTIIAGIDEDGAWYYELDYCDGDCLPVNATVEEVIRHKLGVNEIEEMVKQGNTFFVKLCDVSPDLSNPVLKSLKLNTEVTEFTGVAFQLDKHILISDAPFTIRDGINEKYIHTDSQVKIVHNGYQARYLKPKSVYRIVTAK